MIFGFYLIIYIVTILQEEVSTAPLSSGKTDKVVGNAKMTRKKWGLGWLRLGCN